MNVDFEARVRAVKDRAHGRWASILQAMGVDPKIVNRRNQPCPLGSCDGGRDRFQFRDKYGSGDWICRSCGTGDGFGLAERLLALNFADVLQRVEELIGTLPSAPAALSGPTAEQMKALSRRLWEEASPVKPGDEVDRYLRNRGLHMDVYPRSLRLHPRMGYYEKRDGRKRAVKVAEYPAMLACVQAADGRAVTLHRTYLDDGRKAQVAESKKLLSSGISGAAVRLGEATHELGLTEGVETGLAVLLGLLERSRPKAVWCGINCGNLERLWIPDRVRRVCIYADNDAGGDFAGQVAAYALAQRLVRERKKRGLPITVRVHVPTRDGEDWADVRLARLAAAPRAA